MKNKDKYNLSHLHIVERPGKTRLDGYITYIEIEYSGKIVKKYACTNESGVKKFLEWLEEEYVPEILTEREKTYLSAVIKPFRKDVEWIEKIERYDGENEYIHITVKRNEDCCELPTFKKGTMYKGMEANKVYTLEELGL
jgi:hypothetical protein